MADRTVLVLVRHGESVATTTQVVGGHSGCKGLSPRGREQAEALCDRLVATGLLRTASALVTSVLPRAIETARIIAPGVGDGRLEALERCDLCELHPGEADGLPWVEFSERYGNPRWHEDPTTPLSPGGESWASFMDRARAALRSLADAHPGETVVAAVHGGVIEASFREAGLFDPGGPDQALRPDNTGLTIWSRPAEGGAWRLERYNDVAHLD